jgi:hypothetical protein
MKGGNAVGPGKVVTVGEFDFHVDETKNRLYIRLSGFFRKDESDALFAALKTTLGQVRSGFDAVTDVRDLRPGSPESAADLEKAVQIIRDAGRNRAVRITGGLVTGIMQFKRVVQSVFGNDPKVRYVSSPEEADRILDAPW